MRVLIGASQVGNDFMQFNVEDPIRSHHFFLVSLIFFFFHFWSHKRATECCRVYFPDTFSYCAVPTPHEGLG